jgi:hypothetical protein
MARTQKFTALLNEKGVGHKRIQVREDRHRGKRRQAMLVRRLIETDEMPIGRVSEHSRKDQNVRKGHLCTLHVRP